MKTLFFALAFLVLAFLFFLWLVGKIGLAFRADIER